MIKVVVIDSKTGRQIEIRPGLLGVETLITSTMPQLVGTFKAATRTGTGSTTIVSPDADGSLYLTDLIISTKKSNANSLVINFSDGTNTIKIVEFDVTASIALGISFGGNWQGWKDAYIQMTTDANYNATVAVGYVKIPKISTLEFAAWDALR